ncbi:MAG: hypothetical protein WD334_08815, partial [Chitinophagales bacterium]
MDYLLPKKHRNDEIWEVKKRMLLMENAFFIENTHLIANKGLYSSPNSNKPGQFLAFEKLQHCTATCRY